MDVEIPINALHHPRYCLYLAAQKLYCGSADDGAINITVTLKENSRLSLVTPQGRLLQSTQLQLKTLAPPKTRRRVRTPWRFF